MTAVMYAEALSQRYRGGAIEKVRSSSIISACASYHVVWQCGPFKDAFHMTFREAGSTPRHRPRKELLYCRNY